MKAALLWVLRARRQISVAVLPIAATAGPPQGLVTLLSELKLKAAELPDDAGLISGRLPLV